MLSNELVRDVSPGALTLRPYRGFEDCVHMACIVNAENAADGIEEEATAEEIANECVVTEKYNPHADTVMVELNGETIGQSTALWRKEAEGDYIYQLYFDALPQWRGRLFDMLIAWAEDRGRAIAREKRHPTDIARFFGTWVSDRSTDRIAAVTWHGYAPVRYYYVMLHDHPHAPREAPLPTGVELRPFQPEHFRAVWDAKEEAFRDHWGYSEKSDAEFRAWMARPAFDVSLWQVAWDTTANQIAGFSINTIYRADNERYGFRRGWVDTLGVRRAWRGRGLAKVLLHHSLRVLSKRGMTEVLLGVDAQNPTGALQLYEGMGFRVYRSSKVYRKPM